MVPVEVILILLSPVFFLFIGFEWYHSVRRKLAIYQWRDSLANMILAAMHQAGDALSLLLLLPLFYWLHQFAWLDLPFTALNLLLLFVLQDFLYYWFHRASHRVRWLWASHVAHHSSRLMNFSTAFRQSLTYPLSGMWLFWVPLVLLGFDPKLVLAVVAINLGFQFFVHTRWGKHWGWLGYVLNTPAWHRVHHACNDVYIDKNFAGVLVIWDRLFGSFEPEHDAIPCRFGITEDFESVNPLTITFHEWRRMLTAARDASGVRAKIQVLFGPPRPDPQQESVS
ncbi:sterol desaturase family protein [Rheinheimera tilapiae]|jgi:sterol desaturase/sphingolipid hydroxylase (fatty acid hydroxylase superfamily)|uniref:Sterol desaturase family protein n=1 Tax=Rheinheimera tilapiae TaxID=875043 RepID=A0ABV6BB01_9GAMM